MAAKVAELLRRQAPEKYARLAQQLGLQDAELAQFSQIAAGLSIPMAPDRQTIWQCDDFDTAFAESRYAVEATTALPADAVFEREWALALLNLTMRRLETEFAAAGKIGEFAVLKDSLAAAHGALDYGAVAARLGRSEGAARVAVHRLRKRFRQIYREELAQTLGDGADLDAELRHLAGALVQA